MEYRKLGKTDIDVSVIALGCWPFAGGQYWGDQDDNASIATVHAALDAGINFFDTAEAYEAGHSERVLGRGLLGRREEAIIATKVWAGNLRPDDVAFIAHSTTQATNALLEGDVAKVAVLGIGTGIEGMLAKRATRIPPA